jgi:CheY-like chemotaxis protein
MKSVFVPYCTVIETRDGMEALQVCERTMPDLIITDVMMPNVSDCIMWVADCV